MQLLDTDEDILKLWFHLCLQVLKALSYKVVLRVVTYPLESKMTAIVLFPVGTGVVEGTVTSMPSICVRKSLQVACRLIYIRAYRHHGLYF